MARNLYRQLDAAAFQLTIVQQEGGRQGSDEGRRGALPFRAEALQRTWFVVILEEIEQTELCSRPQLQQRAEAVVIPMHDAVVEIFVVTEVEALGEESLFQIPVDFGQEGEIRKFAPNGGDERRPEFFAWSWFVQVLPPGVGEDVVEQQHRHIAADAVTLHGDAQQGFASGVAVFRGVGVELSGVDPAGEIGIPSVGHEIVPARSIVGRARRCPDERPYFAHRHARNTAARQSARGGRARRGWAHNRG